EDGIRDFHVTGVQTCALPILDLDLIEIRIIEELRLPRMILAFLAGAGLSLAGAVLQMVTRNPLADPYLFGISSGASFGAVLVIEIGRASCREREWMPLVAGSD